MFSLCICKFKWFQTKIFQEYRKSASKNLICCCPCLSFSQKLHQYHIHNFASMFAIHNSKRIPQKKSENSQKIPKKNPKKSLNFPKEILKIQKKKSLKIDYKLPKRIPAEFPKNSRRIPKEFPKDSQRIPKKTSQNSQTIPKKS